MSTSGGASPYDYILLNGSNTVAVFNNVNNVQSFTGLVAGSYTLNVTDNNNCSGSSTISIITLPDPSPTITGQTSFCNGSSTLLDAGAGYSSYLWSTGATTQTISVSSAGNYAVTVSNSNGCIGNASLNVTQINNPAPVISGQASFCNSSSTILDAGAGYSNYLWSTGATTQSISVSSAGNYAVTVSNSNGCIGNASLNVTQINNPTPVISGQTSFCNGSSTVLDAGAGYSSYLWSTGATTQIISVSSAGNYAVTVTNSNGCAGSASVNVTQNSNPTPIINGQTSFCSGSSTALDAGAGYSSYLWSTGATTQSISVSSAGNYAVTITNNNSCIGTAIVNVTQNSNPAPTITGQTSICSEGSTVLDAGAGYSSYLWSTNENTQTIMVVLPGTYTVTVSNINGCTGSASTTVTSYATQIIATSSTNADCKDNNGSATVIGAPNGSTYIWNTNPPQYTQTATGLSSGTYCVTVSHYFCSSIATAIIYKDPGPTASFTYIPENSINVNDLVYFNDQSLGNISNWNWNFGDGVSSDRSQTNHLFSNPGTYSVTLVVSDINGCVDTAKKNVIVNSEFALWIPNSFTPNNDGMNDVFKPLGNGVDTRNYSMVIFDRWGSEVFSTSDFNEAWNGKQKNSLSSNDCNQSVYLYHISVNDLQEKNHIFTGTITLIK